MTEWYVIHRESNRIVNCITTHENDPTKITDSFSRLFPRWELDDYRIDSNPPLSMLEKYRYWNERP